MSRKLFPPQVEPQPRENRRAQAIKPSFTPCKFWCNKSIYQGDTTLNYIYIFPLYQPWLMTWYLWWFFVVNSYDGLNQHWWCCWTPNCGRHVAQANVPLRVSQAQASGASGAALQLLGVQRWAEIASWMCTWAYDHGSKPCKVAECSWTNP